MAAARFDQFITFIQHQIRQHKTFIAQVAEDNLLKNEYIRALLDMEGEGGEPFITTDHVGGAHQMIVDCVGEMVGGDAVGLQQHMVNIIFR